jgi:hypothetical protein
MSERHGPSASRAWPRATCPSPSSADLGAGPGYRSLGAGEQQQDQQGVLPEEQLESEPVDQVHRSDHGDPGAAQSRHDQAQRAQQLEYRGDDEARLKELHEAGATQDPGADPEGVWVEGVKGPEPVGEAVSSEDVGRAADEPARCNPAIGEQQQEGHRVYRG